MGQTNARADVDALMAWWRDAGVDVAVAEEPQPWLSAAGDNNVLLRKQEPRPPELLPAQEHKLPTLPAFASLEAFRDWFATDTALLGAYPPSRRVMPDLVRADLMLVVDQPGRDDLPARQLMSGEVGALLDRMLGALKRDRSNVAIVAMAPARISAELDETALALLTPILQCHIALAAPKKLWLMGKAASRAILGMDVPAAQGRLHCVNHPGVTMDTIATVHPSLLLSQPRLKARVWEDMQRLIGNGNA